MSDLRQAMAIVDQFLEMPEQERSAFLDKACAEQPGLRESVASLLKSVEDATGMLPEKTTVFSPPPDARAMSLSLSIGQHLAGRYEILRVVGVGGMGEVYQAIDRVLGRDVAIKVLRPTDTSDPRVDERFDRELKSVALLSHPNVVTLYDVAYEGQTRFAVMEFISGQTLRGWRASSTPWKAIAEIAYGVASGLSAAHALSIVHRDIKPDNIVIDEQGQAKILDFGIARFVEPESDLPLSGKAEPLVGTVPYMSPEQANRQPSTCASDVFSLGVVLFEALAGQHPFRADGAAETLRNISTTAVDVACEVPEQTPDVLIDLIDHMLSKDSDSRPSITHVVKTLGTVLGWHRQDARTTAVQIEPADRSEPNVLAGPPKIAVLPFATLTNDPACHTFGDAVAQDLIVGLSRLRWLPVIARGSSFRFRGGGVDLVKAAQALGADYLVTGSLQIDARRAVLSVELCAAPQMSVVWADRFEEALDEIMQYRMQVPLKILSSIEAGVQRAEVQRIAGTPGENINAWSAYHRGLDHMFRFKAKDNEEAAQLFNQALKQDPSFARAHAGLSFTHFQNAFLSMAGTFDKQRALAKQAAQRAAEIDPLDPFISLTLGRAAWLYSDLDAAGGWLNQSLQLNPSYAFARYNRALIDVMLSDAGASESNIKQAIRLSPIDPMIYAMHATQAMSHMLSEDFQGAAACADQCIRHPAAHIHTYATATIAHHLAGHDGRASELAGQIRQRDQTYDWADYFRSFPFRDSVSYQRMREALQARLG